MDTNHREKALIICSRIIIVIVPFIIIFGCFMLSMGLERQSPLVMDETMQKPTENIDFPFSLQTNDPIKNENVKLVLTNADDDEMVENSNDDSFSVSREGEIIYSGLDNLYPGASGQFEFQIKNTGTIPAVLKEVVSNFYECSPFIVQYLDITAIVIDSDGTEVSESGPVPDINQILIDAFSAIKLDPGEIVSAKIVIEFDKYGQLTGDQGENQTGIFHIKLFWVDEIPEILNLPV